MAAIKWLQRIIVTTEPFPGYYQTVDYAYWEQSENGPRLVPITEMEVKSAIARPAIGEFGGRGFHLSYPGRGLDGRGGDCPGGNQLRWWQELGRGVVRRRFRRQ